MIVGVDGVEDVIWNMTHPVKWFLNCLQPVFYNLFTVFIGQERADMLDSVYESLDYDTVENAIWADDMLKLTRREQVSVLRRTLSFLLWHSVFCGPGSSLLVCLAVAFFGDKTLVLID